jgi:hypothetical protein
VCVCCVLRLCATPTPLKSAACPTHVPLLITCTHIARYHTHHLPRHALLLAPGVCVVLRRRCRRVQADGPVPSSTSQLHPRVRSPTTICKHFLCSTLLYLVPLCSTLSSSCVRCPITILTSDVIVNIALCCAHLLQMKRQLTFFNIFQHS